MAAYARAVLKGCPGGCPAIAKPAAKKSQSGAEAKYRPAQPGAPQAAHTRKGAPPDMRRRSATEPEHGRGTGRNGEARASSRRHDRGGVQRSRWRDYCRAAAYSDHFTGEGVYKVVRANLESF